MLTLALASAASLMVALDALVVSTALREIKVAFGASVEALEWTVNGYVLSFAVLLLTAAALASVSAGGACSRPGWACSWPPPRPAPWRRVSNG